MRRPTSPSDIYAWHHAALAGGKPQITHEPQAGWFKRKLVKGGVFVPARIWIEQNIDPETGDLVGDEVMRCEVAGKERDPIEEWTWLAGTPISESDYEFLAADAAWLRTHNPTAAQSNPTSPVTRRAIPPLF